MIRRIQYIKRFGMFQDFNWPPNLLEFKKFNLIYGWNYSGKTTLSRVFRCFELKSRHADFAEAQIQLMADDGMTYDLSADQSTPILRVFNSDFIRENLSFADGSATPILVLGQKDIAKQDELRAKKSEKEALKSDMESNARIKNSKTDEIEKGLTKYARDFIKNPLAEVSYDKRRFEPHVTQCKAAPEQHLLDDGALTEYLRIYRSTEKKPTLPAYVVSLSSVEELKAKTALLLARVVAAPNPISRLKENPEVEGWINEGRPLHAGKDTCQFCDQLLPENLLAHLANHFSAEYEDMMSEINALTKLIEAAQEEEIALSHKADFYAELADRFTSQKEKLDELLKARRTTLGELVVALSAKQTKAFTSLKCQAGNDPAEQIAAVVRVLNTIVVEHNQRTAGFDMKRQETFSKLEKHYAALFIREEKYIEVLQKITDLSSAISGQLTKLDELDAEIRDLEQALSEAAKGAEQINRILAAYFGKNDLTISVSPEKRFQILRGTVIAKNLSEGEKTAIAFAYFITSIQDGRHPLKDVVIVVDDPISSLDANHLFNTYALIKTQLADCRQLFISTHSFEFYNLIREWVADVENKQHTEQPQVSWKKWSVFYLKRTDAGTSNLEEIPMELLRFKSEYHYLFSTLYHFDKTGSADFDRLLSLPNIVRRFMEAFSGIMIPRCSGLHGKMQKLFPNDIERERVWKFINHYSHNTTIVRSLSIPDTSECKAVVQACLKAVQDWDLDYFKDLETEVQ